MLICLFLSKSINLPGVATIIEACSTCLICLEYELLQRGFKVERQKTLPVIYNSIKLDAGY